MHLLLQSQFRATVATTVPVEQTLALLAWRASLVQTLRSHRCNATRVSTAQRALWRAHLVILDIGARRAQQRPRRQVANARSEATVMSHLISRTALLGFTALRRVPSAKLMVAVCAQPPSIAPRAQSRRSPARQVTGAVKALGTRTSTLVRLEPTSLRLAVWYRVTAALAWKGSIALRGQPVVTRFVRLDTGAQLAPGRGMSTRARSEPSVAR